MPFSPIHSTLKGTRGQIVEMLRRSPMSANEVAEGLGLTHNAVRNHLATLLRLGVVRESGSRRSSTRPITLYAVEPVAESSLSRAYMPFLAHLVKTLDARLSEAELEQVMRAAGRSLAETLPRPQGSVAARMEAGAELLRELGALVDVEPETRSYVIRGHGCVLAEAVHGRPSVCRAMETLLSDYLSLPVTECCERGERPRCCFRVQTAA